MYRDKLSITVNNGQLSAQNLRRKEVDGELGNDNGRKQTTVLSNVDDCDKLTRSVNGLM